MTRTLKVAALAAAVMLTLSGGAVAQEGRWHSGPADWQYGDHGRRDRFQPGFDQGYRDGSRVANEDMEHRKPFDPYPRGKYSNMDRGYHRDYGNREAYRRDYAEGYRQGYRSAFRHYR